MPLGEDTHVELEEDVEEGQVLATQSNAFGDTRATYTAPWTGRVLSVATDPIREPGALVVRLCRYLEPEEAEEAGEVEQGSVGQVSKALRGSLITEDHDWWTSKSLEVIPAWFFLHMERNRQCAD